MSTCTNRSKITVHLGKTNPIYPPSSCKCNKCTSSDNNKYLIVPEGGSDGDLLVKNGDTFIFVSLSTLLLFNNTVGF